jgi:transcriptional antiterminator RfaH
MKRWHVVHTKPRQEQQALENLERQGYTCFLPTLDVQKVSRGKFRITTEPLFPRYVFIQLEHTTEDAGLNKQSWAPIRSTLGVQRLVSFGTNPAVVGDELIAELAVHHEARQAPEAIFHTDEPVLITQGPFAGIEGIYQRLTQMPSGEARAFVLIELLSKSMALPIAPAHLKKIH